MPSGNGPRGSASVAVLIASLADRSARSSESSARSCQRPEFQGPNASRAEAAPSARSTPTERAVTRTTLAIGPGVVLMSISRTFALTSRCAFARTLGHAIGLATSVQLSRCGTVRPVGDGASDTL